MYYEEDQDCGFELPDRRHEWYTKDGELVSIHIQRHWFRVEDDEDEMNFDVSWQIRLDNKPVMCLPRKTFEEQAIEIASILYPSVDEHCPS